MPPKRKPSVSSPPSILVTSPKTPTTAELANRMLDRYTVTTKLDSSPLLAKSKHIEAEIPAIEEEMLEKNEVHIPDAADDSGTEEASAKQGTAAKKTTALKRKATPTNDSVEPAAKKPKAAPIDETAGPAAKKQKTTLPKRKATPKKKPATAPRKRTKKEEYGPEGDPRPPPPPPLTAAIKRKVSTLHAFFETHPARLPDHEAGSHVVSVDELDLLAALIILRVDYQLADNTVADASIEDADEMIVDGPRDGRVSVDFDKTCELERAAKAKFAGRQTGLETVLGTVNLLEVEIDMLVAKRKRLAEDEMPAAGFRVYGDEGFDGGAAGRIIDQDAAERDDLVLGESTVEEDQPEEGAIGDVAFGEDAIEEDVIEEDAVDEGTIDQDMLDAVADEEESVHEAEQEAVDEQNVDDESEEVSEEE
jgi:hypothetical protein